MQNPWHSLLEPFSPRWRDGVLDGFDGEAPDGAVVVPLTDLAVIRASGADAQAFLNGQLSNDLLSLADNHSQLAGYCSPKGRMLALFRLVRRGDEFLLILPSALLEPVLKRLRMYVLRAKVQLTDASAELLLAGSAGIDPAALGLSAQAPDQGTIQDQVQQVGIHGEGMRQLWIAPPAAMARLWPQLADLGRPGGPQAWRRLDVEAGLPQVYPETQEAFIPQMANLDLVNGLNFNKGCYPGQEIVARMHFLGQLKRRMYRIRGAGDAPPPGAELRTGDGRLAGQVVDAVAGPAGYQGLAVLQSDLALSAPLQWEGAPLEVSPPPYPLPE